MQLAERKALDLDADVRTYVSAFPEKEAKITTRQLLCHQSGIPHYSNGVILATEFTASEKLPFLDPLQGLNKFNRSSLIFQPGEKTSYSSYAYVLLSAVVQQAGKQAFGEQLAQRIAEPLGLSTLQLDLETNGQKHWATGYAKNRAGEIVRAPEEAHYWKHGAGGFKSNVVDFAKWGAGLLNHRLVNGECEQAMWTAQKTLDGKPTLFGLGFQVSGDDRFGVGHGGSQEETKTQMLLDPATKRGIVVMCNCGFGNVKTIAAEIAAILNRE